MEKNQARRKNSTHDCCQFAHLVINSFPHSHNFITPDLTTDHSLSLIDSIAMAPFARYKYIYGLKKTQRIPMSSDDESEPVSVPPLPPSPVLSSDAPVPQRMSTPYTHVSIVITHPHASFPCAAVSPPPNICHHPVGQRGLPRRRRTTTTGGPTPTSFCSTASVKGGYAILKRDRRMRRRANERVASRR